MFLSKRSNGYYYIFYKSFNEKMTCKSTGCKMKSEALKYLTNFGNELQEKIRNKVNPIEASVFFFEFLKYSSNIHSENHTKSLKITFKAFVEFTGKSYLSSINPKVIQSFAEKRLTTVTPITVRRDIANLSTAFTWGISKNYLISNFCKGIKKPKVVEKLPVFFSMEDFSKLLKVIDDINLKQLILFTINTGLRQSEVINLKWNQINFKDNYLILDNRTVVTKSRKVGTVPLNIKALQILTERQLNSNSEYVFTYQGTNIKQMFISHKFKKFVRKAQLDDRYNFHTIRHSTASFLVQNGVSIFEISKLLHHSDTRVTSIYSHLKPENLRNAIEILSNFGE